MNRKKDFPLQATNEYVFLKREEAVTEIGGLLLPDSAVKKTTRGEILSVGDTVQDKSIRGGVGKTAIFHETVGFTISDEGQDYLVLQGSQILAVK